MNATLSTHAMPLDFERTHPADCFRPPMKPTEFHGFLVAPEEPPARSERSLSSRSATGPQP